jgi:hypothetical protein
LNVVISNVGDELNVVLEIRDNLAVNVEDGNDEGASFWLIMCIEPLHKVKVVFTYQWGTSFEEGDDVVGGIYYQRWANNDTSYVLLKDSHKVYLYSHLVKAIKFLMPPKNYQVNGNDPIYELLGEILRNINEVITSLEFED